MAAVVTKQLAQAIAKKLGAVIKERPGKAHDLAEVYHEGRLVAHFGLRRGSNRELGHDHVPGQIFVGPRQARLLGQCPLSRDEWITILAEKGKV
jgi:hypothetical protein